MPAISMTARCFLFYVSSNYTLKKSALNQFFNQKLEDRHRRWISQFFSELHDSLSMTCMAPQVWSRENSVFRNEEDLFHAFLVLHFKGCGILRKFHSNIQRLHQINLKYSSRDFSIPFKWSYRKFGPRFLAISRNALSTGKVFSRLVKMQDENIYKQ